MNKFLISKSETVTMTRLLLMSFTLFLVLSSNIYAQDTLYLDENLKSINQKQYFQKCKADVFKCLEYKTDSLVVNKVLHKYKFGKISEVEYDQIRKLLELDGQDSIKKGATLVIKFYDTLNNFSRLEKHMKKYHSQPDSIP